MNSILLKLFKMFYQNMIAKNYLHTNCDQHRARTVAGWAHPTAGWQTRVDPGAYATRGPRCSPSRTPTHRTTWQPGFLQLSPLGWRTRYLH